MKNRIRLFGLGLSLVLALAGCGGGNDGSDYSLSTTTVTFVGTEGDAPPAAQAVGITVESGTVYIATSQSGNCFTHSFQLTGKASGVVTIVPLTCTGGLHTGAVTVTGCPSQFCGNSGSSQTIHVNYHVAAAPSAPPLTSLPADVDFKTRGGIDPAPRTLTLTLSGGSGTWAHTVGYPAAGVDWLQVSPAGSGSLPATVTVTARVAGLANGRHSANITFRSGRSITTVPVTLEIFDPAVNFVSPYLGTTSVGDEVIIRGHGFSEVASGIEVLFGATPALSATVVNDTEIRARYPALAAGTYPVSVRNAGSTLPSRARLQVMDAVSYPYAVIPVQGQATDIIFDSERRAIYVYDDWVNYRLESFRFNGTTWSAGPVFSFGGRYATDGWALAPDGSELLLAMGGVRRIAPASMTLIGTATATLLNPVFTNDGFAFVRSGRDITSPMHSYDMLAQRTTPLATSLDLSSRFRKASGDGSVVVFAKYSMFINATPEPVALYMASDGSFATTGVSTSNSWNIQLDRIGSRVMLSDKADDGTVTSTVYSRAAGALSALGRLPTAHYDEAVYLVSPAGRYAYGYVKAGNQVRKYDLDSPVSGGFSEVGTGTPLADVPNPTQSYLPTLKISPDGRTLFVVGDQNIIVMPAP
ncbi:MAG: hypothetical protein Tsb007_47210 [Rhizobacter sp.]